MSDLSAAAQELDEDLRLLMHDAFFPTEAVKERVWGCDSGVGRTVEESRDRYRVPIVEAFQASGAPTLAEFPERVRFLADAYYTLLHERDIAKAEADRYHGELVALRESEHNARLQVQEVAAVNANLTAERDRLIREAARGPDTEKRLREEARQLRAERDQARADADRYHAELIDVGQNELHMLRKERDALRRERDEAQANISVMAEQVLSLSARVNEVKAEREQARTSAECLRVMLAGAPGGQLLTEVEQARADLAKQVDVVTAERDKAEAELEDMRERESIARADALHCHQEMRTLRAQRDQYKALAEQQSATVAEGAKTIGEVRAEMAALQREMEPLRGQLSATRTAFRGTCEQLTEARRELEPMRIELAEAKAERDRVVDYCRTLEPEIAGLRVENRGLKRSIRRLCRILGKAMAGDL